MEIKLTAVFRKFPEGYAAFVEELPGANTQGATLDEARENLKEAVEMVLQANRDLAVETIRGADVVREHAALPAGQCCGAAASSTSPKTFANTPPNRRSPRTRP
jgi:predicted RNase H-like HicB family nuclease